MISLIASSKLCHQLHYMRQMQTVSIQML